MSTPLHVVVPAGIDDPARPSGGNVYDRRLVDALREGGRAVEEHAAGRGALGPLLAGLPDDAVVVVDGLVGSVAGPVLATEAPRLRLVVLLHMPLVDAVPDRGVREVERQALHAAAAVIATSRWTRDQVVHRHGVPADRVHVAEPGVDPAATAVPSPAGGRLACVAAVTPTKGHDVLLAALARVADLDWHCTWVGALDLDPAFVEGLRATAREAGVADRVLLTGPLAGPGLRAALDATDLLVSASRHESYGMAVTEALARAVPVVASSVGGHAEALGVAADGSLPGALVPPDDPGRLAGELRRWLTDPGRRARLQGSAAGRRRALRSQTWEATARHVTRVLDRVAVNRPGRPLVLPSTGRATGPTG